MVEWLDEDNKDNFDVYKRSSLVDCLESFIFHQSKENNLEGNLARQCIIHHNYGKEGGWYEIHVHLSHHHKHFREQDKNKHIDPAIYHTHWGYMRESGWYVIYIHIFHNHQLLIQDLESKSGWSLDTKIHLFHCHHFDHHKDKIHYCERKSGWFIDT